MSAIMSATADFGHGPVGSGALGGLATATRFSSRDSVSLFGRSIAPCSERPQVQPSIFLRQHDRDDALGHRGIGWVGRVIFQILVEIIDLEKDCMAVGFERAEIVLLMRIVGVAKVVIDLDGLDDTGDGFGAEGSDSRWS